MFFFSWVAQRWKSPLAWWVMLALPQSFGLKIDPHAVQGVTRSSEVPAPKRPFFSQFPTAAPQLVLAASSLIALFVLYKTHCTGRVEQNPKETLEIVLIAADTQEIVGEDRLPFDQLNKRPIYQYIQSHYATSTQPVYKICASLKKIPPKANAFVYCKKNKFLGDYLTFSEKASTVYLFFKEDTTLAQETYSLELHWQAKITEINDLKGNFDLINTLRIHSNDTPSTYFFYTKGKGLKNAIYCWGDNYSIAQLFIDSEQIGSNKTPLKLYVYATQIVKVVHITKVSPFVLRFQEVYTDLTDGLTTILSDATNQTVYLAKNTVPINKQNVPTIAAFEQIVACPQKVFALQTSDEKISLRAIIKATKIPVQSVSCLTFLIDKQPQVVSPFSDQTGIQ